MKKTLILCFIHGFKVSWALVSCFDSPLSSSRGRHRSLTRSRAQGGETTFGEGYRFTEHLRDAVAEKLPKVDVRVLVYPKFETRGDLGDCVSRFRGW
jgi:hypothetical protein